MARLVSDGGSGAAVLCSEQAGAVGQAWVQNCACQSPSLNAPCPSLQVSGVPQGAGRILRAGGAFHPHGLPRVVGM